MVEVSTPFQVFTCFCFLSPVSEPLGARAPLLTKRGSFPCGRYVHGLRVVCPPYSSQPGEFGCVLEVFDFNVHPTKLREATNTIWSAQSRGASKGTVGGTNEGRAGDSRLSTPSSFSSSSSHPPSTRPSTPISSSISSHEVTYTIHTDPSKVSVPGVFVDDVISKLPYSQTVRKDLTTMYSGFMIDDERIVGLKVGVLFFLCVSWG